MINVFPDRRHPDLPSDAAYSPSRDVAYVVPALVHQMMPRAVEGGRVPAWLKGHIQDNKLTEADLQKGVEVMIRAVDACADLSVKDAMGALAAGGLDELTDAKTLPPFAILGMLVFSYYFQGVRDACRGDKPHRIVVASEAMQDVIAAGREAQRKDPWFGRFLRSRKEGQ